jgi:hypothetical protein
MLGGCRFKGGESFLTATTPQPRQEDGRFGSWGGDPYAKADMGEASGGVYTRRNYGAGARTDGTGPLNPAFDQPAKGTGLHPGDQSVEARPGFGHTNAPAHQNLPGSVEQGAQDQQ